MDSHSSLRKLLFRYRRYCPNLRDGSAAQMLSGVNHADRLVRTRRGRPALVRDLSSPFVLAVMRAVLASNAKATRNRTTNSERTANNVRTTLLTLWRWAEDQGYPVRPVPRRPPPKFTEPDVIPIAWTLAEVRRLTAAAADTIGEWGGIPRSLIWQLGISVLWDTAARVGELRAAKVADVSMETGLWTVEARNRKGRRRWKVYKLHPDTLTLIRRRTEWAGEKLWPLPWRRPASMWEHYGKLLQAAGLPNDRKHKFQCIRRTAESYAAAERGISWAAACVGHGEAIARRHYISPMVCPGPALIEVLPRI